MSKPVNKTLIGAFVLGAVVLAVLAVVIFGSGRLFADKMVNVMYFEGSVKGLNVGAAVVFRGVRIGSVTNVHLQFDPKDASFLIPVYAEIDLSKVKVIGNEPKEDQLSRLIAKGLRAQLELQSIVTGQLMINMDFFPGKPARIVGLDKKVPEVPTIPSDLDEFMKLASTIPLKDLVDKLMKSLEGIEKAVNSPKLAASIDSMNEALTDTRKILKKIDHQVEPILVNLKDSSVSVKEMLAKTEGVPRQIDQALAATYSTLQQAEKTLLSVQGIASDNSSLVLQMDSTLQEVGRTSRSVRTLTDYLQRYPEAVLKGKQAVKGE